MDGRNPEDDTKVIKALHGRDWKTSTLSVHGDDALNSTTDVAPAMHTSTTFRYPSDPNSLIPSDDNDVRSP